MLRFQPDQKSHLRERHRCVDGRVRLWVQQLLSHRNGMCLAPFQNHQPDDEGLARRPVMPRMRDRGTRSENHWRMPTEKPARPTVIHDQSVERENREPCRR